MKALRLKQVYVYVKVKAILKQRKPYNQLYLKELTTKPNTTHKIKILNKIKNEAIKEAGYS